MRSGLMAFWVALALSSAPAWCCTLNPDRIYKSNFEMALDAPHIVLARAKALHPKHVPNAEVQAAYRVEMEIVESMKGRLPKPTFFLDGFGGFVGAGDETDFTVARPGAQSGACVPMDYRLGRLYLLFLVPDRTKPGALEAGGIADSRRVNEEVSGPESPWVIAVRHYLRIARYRDADVREMALASMALMWEPGWFNFPKALRDDIESHFQHSSAGASTELQRALRSAFRIPERGFLKQDARLAAINQHLEALARRGHADALPLFFALLDQPNWYSFSNPIQRMSKRHPALAVRLKEAHAEASLVRSIRDQSPEGLPVFGPSRPSWRTPPSSGS